jgi:arylformamidase
VELIDISVPVRPGMHVWDGDPPFRVDQVASMAEGEEYNVTRLNASTHTGTHIDAPLHFVDGGGTVDRIPLEVLVGPCHVVDATAVEGQLDAAALAGLELPAETGRLLFKTRNGALWGRDSFSPDFCALTGDGAETLVALGVRLAGIDYLSIGDFDAHRVLLGVGVVPLEGLDLRAVEPGPYTLFCLPLKLAGTEGAPARALLVRE